MNRDLIVIGASVGGLQPLQDIMAKLPAELPASVLVVMHVGTVSYLADILGRTSKLKVANAVSGAPLEQGRTYVAPPGRHLLVHGSHILLRRGPRENMVRPAIDPLFRSAAASFGSRVIGVVLSGALSDGTAGLKAVKRCGGTAAVQAPEDAAVPDMPRSAQCHVRVDYSLPAAKLPGLLTRLATEPAGPMPAIPLDIKLEAAMAAQEMADGEEGQLGRISRLSCPECQVPFWEIADTSMLRYRCRIGHAHTGGVSFAGQAAKIESTLWRLLRSHQDRAGVVRRMAEQERANNRIESADRLQKRAREYEEDAGLVRQFLQDQGIEEEPGQP